MSDANRLPRRDVFKFLTAAPLAAYFPGTLVAREVKLTAQPYGTDPNLMRTYAPGDLWPLTLGDGERKTAIAFADLLLPADDLGPAASELRVVDYVDEWISSPYDQTKWARQPVMDGLVWLEEEAMRRFKRSFADLDTGQQGEVVDLIADREKAEDPSKNDFFRVFRDIAMGAYYGTSAGWKAIGYVGNQPTVNFDGPPQEVLDELGLEQTVK